MESSCSEWGTYTHGYSSAVIGGHSRRTALNSASTLLGLLRPGMSLLDVGSGAGTITCDLAAAVAPGTVVALEVTDEAAELTRRTARERGIDNIQILVGDAHHMQFSDNFFDAVHAHQVLQHVSDPVQMLREMWRVTAPGGVVAARDADYPTFGWFPRLPELDRWLELYMRAAHANGGHPDAGVRLKLWAEQAGLKNIQAGAAIWSFSQQADLEWWSESWAERISHTQLAEQIVREGWATQDQLDNIAAGWRRWATEPGAYFTVPHGELIARK